MVLDSPNMDFLFGLDMLRKHQVAFYAVLDLKLMVEIVVEQISSPSIVWKA